MKKESLIIEIALRISRILVVCLLSFILYPFLKDFFKEHENIISFSLIISTIIIYMIMLVISAIYLFLKILLLGDNFDNKNKMIVFFNDSLIIILFVFFTIHSRNLIGLKYSILTLFIFETLGFIKTLYDKYMDSDEIKFNKTK